METTVESTKKPPVVLDGSRMDPFKAEVAQALLSQGFSGRKITETLSTSRAMLKLLSHQKVASSARAEKVKRGLRDRWALLADSTLTGITKNKIQESSAKELAYIAAKATEMAGLAPPSIVESYHQSLNAFVIQEPASASAQVVQAETQAGECLNGNTT